MTNQLKIQDRIEKLKKAIAERDKYEILQIIDSTLILENFPDDDPVSAELKYEYEDLVDHGLDIILNRF